MKANTRVLTGLLVGVLLPGLSCADIIQYTFTGVVSNDPENPSPIPWNGPGPEPATFQMTFDVNTLNPANSVSYTFGPNDYTPPSIQNINASLAATNFTLSVDGKLVSQSASALFDFGGSIFGGSSFLGPFSAGSSAGGFSGVGDFYFGDNSQAAVEAAADPLSLLLNGSGFFTDYYTVFNYDGYSLESYVRGEGTLVGPTPVPEPGVLPLLALGGLGLVLVHRRRASSSPPALGQ